MSVIRENVIIMSVIIQNVQLITNYCFTESGHFAEMSLYSVSVTRKQNKIMPNFWKKWPKYEKIYIKA